MNGKQVVNSTNAGKGILIIIVISLAMMGLETVRQALDDNDYMMILMGVLLLMVSLLFYMFKQGYFGPKPDVIIVDDETKDAKDGANVEDVKKDESKTD